MLFYDQIKHLHHLHLFPHKRMSAEQVPAGGPSLTAEVRTDQSEAPADVEEEASS